MESGILNAYGAASKKNYLGNGGGKVVKKATKPRYDPEVLAEIEEDIFDEESYEPSDTMRGSQRNVRKAANARIRQKLPDVYDFVFERGEHESAPGIETVQDAQAFVKKRAQEIYNRRRGIKPKKVKSKMGKHSKKQINSPSDEEVDKKATKFYLDRQQEAINEYKKKKNNMGKRSKKHTTPTENLKNKKAKNKMGGNGSAIFSGANTINFTNNSNGTETVKAMGASAQDIKTAYRKASLNA